MNKRLLCVVIVAQLELRTRRRTSIDLYNMDTIYFFLTGGLGTLGAAGPHRTARFAVILRHCD